jgi:hypothetical protein
MGEVEMGFALDEVETDGVEWARRPKVRLGHKKGSVKDDRGGIPRSNAVSSPTSRLRRRE